jgi:hypothetical protein
MKGRPFGVKFSLKEINTPQGEPYDKDKYVGLDVDQATIVAYVSDAEGGFVMETMLETKPLTRWVCAKI